MSSRSDCFHSIVVALFSAYCAESHSLSAAIPGMKYAEVSVAVCIEFEAGRPDQASNSLLKYKNFSDFSYRGDFKLYPSQRYFDSVFKRDSNGVVKDLRLRDLGKLRMKRIAESIIEFSRIDSVSIQFVPNEVDWQWRWWGNYCGEESVLLLNSHKVLYLPSFKPELPQSCNPVDDVTPTCELICSEKDCMKYSFPLTGNLKP